MFVVTQTVLVVNRRLLPQVYPYLRGASSGDVSEAFGAGRQTIFVEGLTSI